MLWVKKTNHSLPYSTTIQHLCVTPWLKKTNAKITRTKRHDLGALVVVGRRQEEEAEGRVRADDEKEGAVVARWETGGVGVDLRALLLTWMARA